MDCEQVRELEAAFALDALDDDERAAVAAHLDTCAEHGNVVEQRATAILLASTAAERQPPAMLRERLLASATLAGPDARRARPVRWWYAAAAAICVAVIGGAIAALLAARDDTSDLYVKEFATGDGVAVRVEADLDDRFARVTFNGLDEGAEYHLWAIRGSDWLSMGAFRSNPEGRWSGEFPFQVMADDSLCLTEGKHEPVGPFGEPVFVEPLL